MQIIMNQDEIEEAIIALVHRQLSLKDGQNISIDLKAGRGDNGFTATLDIRSMLGSIAKPTSFRGAAEPEETVAPEPAGKPPTRRAATPAKVTAAQEEAPASPATEPDQAGEEAPEATPETTQEPEVEASSNQDENTAEAPAEDPLAVPDSTPPVPKPTSIFNFKNTKQA